LFTQRIALLEGELAEGYRALDTTEANPGGISDVAATVERRREESKRECSERVQELTLPQT
jgi:hypothetical protein